MSLPKLSPLQRPDFPLVDANGRPTQAFAQYLARLDALVAALSSNAGVSLTNAANDAAAAAAGVPVGSLYRNGSVLMARIV